VGQIPLCTNNSTKTGRVEFTKKTHSNSNKRVKDSNLALCPLQGAEEFNDITSEPLFITLNVSQ